MRVHLKTLGCRLNEAELQTWSRDFHRRGHQLTRQIDDAELVVVNTCAVTEEAVKKSRKLLRKAQRDNPHARLVVSGCYASLAPDATAAIDGVDLVVANQDKARLVDIAHQQLELHAMPDSTVEPDISQLLFSGRQRAFIKVQDGCRYRCTYCIVTLARGEERSRSIEEILAEINLLHAQGIQEVVLTGVHLGGYGSDNSSDLAQLVRAVLQHTDIPRIRLGSLEPWELTDNFWSLFDDARVMPHLHLPLQSGADSVLRRMARRCRTEEFHELVRQARSSVPGFNITTDIIVGFPGETEQEWQQSIEFIESVGFGHVHIFAFSPRAGTKAATLAHPISQEIKRERSQQLHDLASRMKAEQLQAMVGRDCEVLFEGNPQELENGTTSWSGYTENFFRVSLTSSGQDLYNRIETVRIIGVSENHELQAEFAGPDQNPWRSEASASACSSAAE
ncbi:MAG: tRNA (N(6)-L-threonylcarbamoyladenosine(37)-C(2))-methylthiotransferase MtaB [Chromatiales bacterium]|jgi:threonylcarbamoyladenosine tRNA methylthiotransferase MtaB